MGTVVTRLALGVCVVGVAAGLSACSSIRDAMGAGKTPPDEFTVVTQAPLIVPPDYNLRPPEPGAAPRNIQDPSAQAHAALYSVSAEAQAQELGPNYSEGEKVLLTHAGATNADPGIRAQIAAETRYEIGDPGLTDRVLTGQTVVAPPASVVTAPGTAGTTANAPVSPAAVPPPAPAASPAPASGQ